MQRRRGGGGVLALQKDVGDVLATEGLELDRILEGAGHYVRTVDFAQGYDLLEII
jgi:hypothetical protein